MRKIKKIVSMRVRKEYPTLFNDPNTTLNDICEYLEALGFELYGIKKNGINRGSFYDLFNGRKFSNERTNALRQEVIGYAIASPKLTLENFLTKKRKEYEQKPKGGASFHKKNRARAASC
jgi:hypothetical protein